MTEFKRAGGLLAAIALLLAGAPALSFAAEVTVKLDAGAQRRLGIATAPLAAARKGATASGFARVLDPIPLATLDSDLTAAAAAAVASQKEAARTRALAAADQTVSQHAAETAAAQARSESARLTLLRRRVGLEWGPRLAALPDPARGRLIAEIAAGRAALVRIDSVSGLIGVAGSAVLDLGPAGSAVATLMGPTRTGDPRLQSTGLLGLVRGPQALRLGVGVTAPATMSLGADAAGVVVPREALLRTAGQTFAYVRVGAASFERRPLTGAMPDPGGLFVRSGFRAGEPVVVHGAAQIFAAESPSRGGD